MLEGRKGEKELSRHIRHDTGEAGRGLPDLMAEGGQRSSETSSASLCLENLLVRISQPLSPRSPPSRALRTH